MGIAKERGLAGLVVVLLAGCGGGGPQDQASSGTKVILETSALFAREPDFESRLNSTALVALEYWGGNPADLDGRTITFVDAPSVPCNGAAALGCFDGNIRLTTIDPGAGQFNCVEATVLVHEIGHLVIGDPNHTDPRWMQMDAVATELGGRPGYTSDGESPCVPAVSVWRHPLNSP